MEEKTREISMEEIKDSLIPLVDEIRPLTGKVFVIDSSAIRVNEDGSISVINNDGIIITYPPITDPWMTVFKWIKMWNDDVRKSATAFFSYIAFPVISISNRFDDEFVNNVADDIISMENRSVSYENSFPLSIISASGEIIKDLLSHE